MKALFGPCAPHELSNTGKNFGVPFSEIVINGVNNMRKHKLCKARNRFLSIFGEKCKPSGQVQWFLNLEHLNQINSIGLIMIRDNFFAECDAKKYSKNSENEFLVRLKEIEFLYVAMFELAAAADAVSELCRLTYVLEGDTPLTSVAYKSLTKFEVKFGSLEKCQCRN